MTFTAEDVRVKLGWLNVWNCADTYRRATGITIPMVVYRAAQTGRAPLGAAWQVQRGLHRRTDPEEGYWRDQGYKTFNITRRGDRDARLNDAITWAAARYQIPEWGRGPAGLYSEWWIPLDVAEWAKGRLAATRAGLREEERAREAEKVRRGRVVHGWAFRDLSDAEIAEIRAYLDGGPVPESYAGIDAGTPPPRWKGGRWV